MVSNAFLAARFPDLPHHPPVWFRGVFLRLGSRFLLSVWVNASALQPHAWLFAYPTDVCDSGFRAQPLAPSVVSREPSPFSFRGGRGQLCSARWSLRAEDPTIPERRKAAFGTKIPWMEAPWARGTSAGLEPGRRRFGGSRGVTLGGASFPTSWPASPGGEEAVRNALLRNRISYFAE